MKTKYIIFFLAIFQLPFSSAQERFSDQNVCICIQNNLFQKGLDFKSFIDDFQYEMIEQGFIVKNEMGLLESELVFDFSKSFSELQRSTNSELLNKYLFTVMPFCLSYHTNAYNDYKDLIQLLETWQWTDLDNEMERDKMIENTMLYLREDNINRRLIQWMYTLFVYRISDFRRDGFSFSSKRFIQIQLEGDRYLSVNGVFMDLDHFKMVASQYFVGDMYFSLLRASDDHFNDLEECRGILESLYIQRIEKLCLGTFGKKYWDLDESAQKEVLEVYPLLIKEIDLDR